jgi:hypothetical protein
MKFLWIKWVLLHLSHPEIIKETIVFTLLNEFHGLKKAPRLWNDAFNATLDPLHFTRCDANQSAEKE